MFSITFSLYSCYHRAVSGNDRAREVSEWPSVLSCKTTVEQSEGKSRDVWHHAGVQEAGDFFRLMPFFCCICSGDREYQSLVLTAE